MRLAESQLLMRIVSWSWLNPATTGLRWPNGMVSGDNRQRLSLTALIGDKPRFTRAAILFASVAFRPGKRNPTVST